MKRPYKIASQINIIKMRVLHPIPLKNFNFNWMKNYITLLILLIATTAFAQETLEVKVEDRPSSLGVQTAFEVLVPQATPDEAIDLWKKTITPKKFLKKTPKLEKVKDEWIVNNILIRDITNHPLNVITQVSSFPGHIYIRIFLQSEGGFLGSWGSSQQTTEAAEKFIYNYAIDLYRQAIEKELKQEEKVLKSLEKDQDKLMNKNKKYNEKIDDAQQERTELRGSANYQEQLLKDSKNDRTISDGTTNDDLKKELKANKKDLKKAKRAEAKFEKKAKKNMKSQRDKANEIEKQNIKIEEVKIKLENIK